MSKQSKLQVRRPFAARQQGFFGTIVGVGLFALAGTAGFLSIVINSAENRQTLRVLTDGTDAEREALSDQQIRNLRNDLNDNLCLLYTSDAADE